MKVPSALLLLAIVSASAPAQDTADVPDPTRASARLRSALRSDRAALPELSLKGLVIGQSPARASVALETPAKSRIVTRVGQKFTVVIDDEPRKLAIQRIGPDGIEIEAPGEKETTVIPPAGLADPGTNAHAPGDVAYAEFSDLPLLDALRMLSEQTGRNFSASVDANKIPVNAMLRHVPASSVVEEICKSHGLWFKEDPATGIVRIMTVAEFEKDLVGFREEQTEIFTLKYPNVAEVAQGIADLYGDRVHLSLGPDETDDEMRRDLENRFDRFDVLAERTQNAASYNTFGGNTVIAGSVGGYSAGGLNHNGVYSSSSRTGRSDDAYRHRSLRNDRNDAANERANDEEFRKLTPELVDRVTRALRSDVPSREGDVESLRKRAAAIHVTASRRNNLVVVRSADSRAMEDIRTLVPRLDVPTPLVLLEVQIVSIDLGTDFRSAFDYQFSDGGTSAGFSRENLAVPPDDGVLAMAGLNSSDMTFVVVNDNFRARMQLFEQKNRVKTLATPTLLTANNEVSRLFLGEERPLIRSINSQTIVTDNNVATTPNTTTEFRPIGDTLLITPNINADRTVTLRVVQEHSSINKNAANIPVVTGSSVQQVPIDTVSTRSIKGTFVAKDGMAVAAGGFIELVDGTRRGQVPVLGDVPLLGFLFRRQEDANARREMVVVLRPHVLNTPADSERLTRDVLGKLAPASMERLAEKGLLPALDAIPPPESRPPGHRPAASRQK